MARRKKSGGGGGDELPAWLITFSDMMTLLLTFFVLLNSMAVIDEQRRLVTLGSLVGTFGMGDSGIDTLSQKPSTKTIESGPMEDVDDLEPLKPLLWDEYQKDLRFAENRFVQIFSIGADILFEPGGTAISETGQKLLARIQPVLAKVGYPILFAGHTSDLRDELGFDYRPAGTQSVLDPSFRLSLDRALAVYRFFLASGLDPSRLRLEGFGRYHNFAGNDTPAGRAQNRRVDIVIDKREGDFDAQVAKVLPQGNGKPASYEYKGFVFDVDGTPPSGGGK